MVAGHQIALNLASITFMVPLGIAMALPFESAGDRRDPKRLARASQASHSPVVLALAGFGMFVFRLNSLASIQKILPCDKWRDFLYMAALFQISDGLQVAGAGALRGLKDTRFPMAITFISYWLIGMPLGYTLGIAMGGGARSMWIGIIFGLTTAAILLNTRFYLVTRRFIQQ